LSIGQFGAFFAAPEPAVKGATARTKHLSMGRVIPTFTARRTHLELTAAHWTTLC
jgi:hypothetical protein